MYCLNYYYNFATQIKRKTSEHIYKLMIEKFVYSYTFNKPIKDMNHL